MTKNNLIIENNISNKFLNYKLIKKISKNYKKIFNEILFEKNNPNKIFNLFSENFRFNFDLNEIQKFKKFKKIAIIGMGGSILGSEAINNFLEKKKKKKVYFFDNLEQEKISNFKKNNKLKNILFIIISKSGNTIETLSNVLYLNIIKKNSKNIILITEKKNNFLLSLVQKYNLFFVEHKRSIGGRFSVLSEVGLLPAYLMGINIKKLRLNIKKIFKKKESLILKKSTINLAALLSTKKLTNLIFLNYAPELEKFLFWCQQLIAESLGKNGYGFLPVISNAPKDHHSLLQLYLDGPKDKFFNIFSIKQKSKEKINMGNIGFHSFLNQKKLDVIKYSQKQALIKSFKKNKIPFREFIIKSVDEEVLGKLFSFFILETVIAAKLLKINPFDQPAVEQVKVYTKNILS
mgnify:CR=1 FL=1